MKTAIMWFKTDLRLADNETFAQAIASSDQVIPVYVWDERLFEKTPYGTLKTGIFRKRFLVESLIDLDKRLRSKGSGLMLLKGSPEIEIPKLAQAYHVQKVFAKREVAFEEKQTAPAVEKALWKVGCELEIYSTSTLFRADDLPFSIKQIPEVFTAFRTKVEKDSFVRELIAEPEVVVSPTIPKVNWELPEIMRDNRAVLLFEGGETAALSRLNDYLFVSKSVASYKQTRNELIGPDYSSKFSVWLAQGCLSPKTIYHEVRRFEELHGANDSTYWLIFELIWRDFFRFLFKKHNERFFYLKGIKSAYPNQIIHNEQLLETWKKGETGNDFIDANMKELNATGFMSNRGRQLTASYFCYELQLDWRLGAAYFEEQLIDYDVSSNWGNWAYIAGVGNDPRGGRALDIEKQTQQYDKNATYRKLWLETSN
ncbi:MAG: DASH family cryptochrome [Fluviicola sp.]|nr:DASH family cryptochrome [Fluviicola sp.]